MTDHTILHPFHLGTGQPGKARKRALEQLATEADCRWGDRPSVGRYLKKIAEEKMALKAIVVDEQEFTIHFQKDCYRVFSTPREWFSGQFDFETGRFSGMKNAGRALVSKLRAELGLARQYKAVADSGKENTFDDEWAAAEWLAGQGGNVYDMKLDYRCSGVGVDGGAAHFRPDGSAGY